MQKLSFFFWINLLSFTLLPAQSSFNMSLWGHWDSDKVPALSNDEYGIRYNEVWGWVNPQTGREYALIGSQMGVHIIDVSDKEHIKEVDFVAGRSDSVINRDFKSEGNYVYAFAHQKAGSMQIWDMATLPDSVHIVYDDVMYADKEKKTPLFDIAHAIFIENNRLYITNPRYPNMPNDKGLAVLDISDPTFPTVKKIYTKDDFGGVHALFVRNDTAYLNSGGSGLYIVDMKDLDNPIVLYRYEGYPFSGFNHTGWLSDTGKIYVMADETWGTPVKVLDVKDPTNPTLLSYLNPYMVYDSNAIPHNQFVVGQYAITSYYYDGVQIYDISDPKNPSMAGYYDTYPQENDHTFKGCWGVYPFLPSGRILASDMQTGLYVLDFAPFSKPKNNQTLLIYPNPGKGILHIKTQEILRQPVFRLFNNIGQIVIEKKFSDSNNFSWDLPDLAKGLYFLEIADANGKRFIEKVLR